MISCNNVDSFQGKVYIATIFLKLNILLPGVSYCQTIYFKHRSITTSLKVATQTKMSALHLPQEIMEKILSYCDYVTLKMIKQSVPDWKQIVEYTVQKRINAEIPPNTFEQIKRQWKGSLEIDKLYENWKRWEDIKRNITFEDNVFYKEAVEDKHIFCISMAGDYVAVSFDTSVEIFKNSACIKTFYFSSIEDDITKIHLVCSAQCDSQVPTELLTATYDEVYITDLSGSCADYVLTSGNGFSAYKQYFYRLHDSAVIIGHVFKDECAGKESFQVDITLPIKYDTSSFICTSMSDTKCILLIDNVVSIINYEPGSSIHGHITVSTLEFTMDYDTILGYFRAWIVQDSVMLILYWGRTSDDEVLEIYKLTDNVGSRLSPVKMYRPYDILEFEVNYISFYANTLLLCGMNGVALFYEISDWNHFDISAYSKRIELTPLRPIQCIYVSEVYKERIFYLAGPHQILCISGKAK